MGLRRENSCVVSLDLFGALESRPAYLYNQRYRRQQSRKPQVWCGPPSHRYFCTKRTTPKRRPVRKYLIRQKCSVSLGDHFCRTDCPKTENSVRYKSLARTNLANVGASHLKRELDAQLRRLSEPEGHPFHIKSSRIRKLRVQRHLGDMLVPVLGSKSEVS